MTFSMVKKKLKQHPEKACFGTKEWSKNSGICNNCNRKDDCGKIEAIRQSKI